MLYLAFFFFTSHILSFFLFSPKIRDLNPRGFCYVTFCVFNHQAVFQIIILILVVCVRFIFLCNWYILWQNTIYLFIICHCFPHGAHNMFVKCFQERQIWNQSKQCIWIWVHSLYSGYYYIGLTFVLEVLSWIDKWGDC